jgi:MtN3 and saliva related transmembrane protein
MRTLATPASASRAEPNPDVSLTNGFATGVGLGTLNEEEDVGAEIVGWVSSSILVVSVAKQVYKQWKQGVSEGVSLWLFLGQVAASAGFVIYSWSVQNWVFVLTNLLMLGNGTFGLVLVLRARRRAKRG